MAASLKLLVSGEGPSDIGKVGPDGRFAAGPMACIVDRLCEAVVGYSMLRDEDRVRFVHKQELSRGSRPVRLPGTKHSEAYHFGSAYALGILGSRESAIAILFRDVDGTRSASRNRWRDIRESISEGFRHAGFGFGVPMVPNPKSEAWMLCALRATPYRGCAALEERSGNDASPNSLKQELLAILGGDASAEHQAQQVRNGRVDPLKIDMPSFHAFREDLNSALSLGQAT